MKYFCQQDALKIVFCYLFENNCVFESFDQTIIATTKFSSYSYMFLKKIKAKLLSRIRATLTPQGNSGTIC